MTSSITYLNGEFLPLENAKISVMDRGFLFGDGVYEVIPVYDGKLFRMQEHVQRLQMSFEAIRIDNPLSDSQWLAALNKLIATNGGGDLALYLQVSRGSAWVRDHTFPKDAAPTVFAMVSPLKPIDIAGMSEGYSAITLDDIRWQWCHVKTTALLGNVLLKQQAADENHLEAILIRDGYATEGSSTNLFVVNEGVIFTPPKSPALLPGITRDLVVELANDNGLECREEPVALSLLQAADEIWVTSSTKEVAPIVELDGKVVGSGMAGPVWQQMIALFQDYKRAL